MHTVGIAWNIPLLVAPVPVTLILIRIGRLPRITLRLAERPHAFHYRLRGAYVDCESRAGPDKLGGVTAGAIADGVAPRFLVHEKGRRAERPDRLAQNLVGQMWSGPRSGKALYKAVRGECR